MSAECSGSLAAGLSGSQAHVFSYYSRLCPPNMARSGLELMLSAPKASPSLMAVTAGAGSSFPSREMRGIPSLLKEERVCSPVAVAGAVLPEVSSPLMMVVVAVEGSVGEKG